MNFMAMTFDERASDVGDLFDAGGAQLTDHVAEQQLLGYLLHKVGAVTETLDIIKPHDLHDPFNRRLYELLVRAYETDTAASIESLVAGLGGEKSAGIYIARMMSEADLNLDLSEIADHLVNIAERRAVGTEDIDFDRGAPFVSKFGGVRWEDIGAFTGPVAYTWFVEDIIPMGEISLVFGDSGSGKSFNMFDLSMSAARGIKWNGHNVEKGLVIYVAAEAGNGFSKRKAAYTIHHKLEPSDPLPFYLITRRPNFFHDDTDAVALIEEINGVIRAYNVPLVCIVMDTLSALAPGMNENASQDVSMVRNRLVMLQQHFNAAIILVHHKPKGGSTPRGHGSLTGDFETTIEFETKADRSSSGKPVHRATSRKQREGKAGAFWEFTLPVVEVGKNRWGNPETSCVVEPYGNQTPPNDNVRRFRVTPTERLFMSALLESIVDHGVDPPAGLPASITKVVEFRFVRTLMRERTVEPHEDNEVADTRFRVAFKRAGDKLRDGGVIGVQGNLLWHTGKAII